MDQMDKFMAEYKSNFDRRATRRRSNPVFRALEYRGKDPRLLRIPRKDPMDPNFLRVQYIRYADDFLVGVIGRKAHAKKIRGDLKEWLSRELYLTLNEDKTLITNFTSGSVDFLGYRLHRTPRSKLPIRYNPKTGHHTLIATRVQMDAPLKKLYRSLREKGFIRKKFRPTRQTR